MKKTLFLSICTGLLLLSTSCGGSKSNKESANDSLITQLSDSLLTINAEKDSLMALMSEINDGMLQIKDMEKILTSSNLSSETKDKKTEIKDNMLAIQQALEARRKKLETLEARLKKSSAYSESMKKTIDGMKKQIEEQELTILSLQEELQKANIKIEGLNSQVDSLSAESNRERAQKVLAQEEATRLANELNTCYYVVGSKSELKDNRIIESGFLKKTKILEGDFEKSYFTKADKRSLSTIPLHSKKAKVLSKHPSGSYEIEDNDGVKTLKITNATTFWELSNYLIIQID